MNNIIKSVNKVLLHNGDGDYSSVPNAGDFLGVYELKQKSSRRQSIKKDKKSSGLDGSGHGSMSSIFALPQQALKAFKQRREDDTEEVETEDDSLSESQDLSGSQDLSESQDSLSESALSESLSGSSSHSSHWESLSGSSSHSTRRESLSGSSNHSSRRSRRKTISDARSRRRSRSVSRILRDNEDVSSDAKNRRRSMSSSRMLRDTSSDARSRRRSRSASRILRDTSSDARSKRRSRSRSASRRLSTSDHTKKEVEEPDYKWEQKASTPHLQLTALGELIVLGDKNKKKEELPSSDDKKARRRRSEGHLKLVKEQLEDLQLAAPLGGSSAHGDNKKVSKMSRRRRSEGLLKKLMKEETEGMVDPKMSRRGRSDGHLMNRDGTAKSTSRTRASCPMPNEQWESTGRKNKPAPGRISRRMSRAQRIEITKSTAPRRSQSDQLDEKSRKQGAAPFRRTNTHPPGGAAVDSDTKAAAALIFQSAKTVQGKVQAERRLSERKQVNKDEKPNKPVRKQAELECKPDNEVVNKYISLSSSLPKEALSGSVNPWIAQLKPEADSEDEDMDSSTRSVITAQSA